MYGETLAIEDYVDEEEDDQQTNGFAQSGVKTWAQLIPLNSSLQRTDLVEPNEKYVFGKGEESDVVLPAASFSQSHLALISKKHFIIHKEPCSAKVEDFDVILQDISSNGTLVNGKKVGKDKFRVLQPNDEISLAMNSIKVFMYVSVKSVSSSLHSDVTDKYLVSKLLGKGACGEVFLVFLEADYSKQYAMKVVDKKSFTSSVIAPSAANSGVLRNSANDVMSEVNILKRLQHPCIIHVQEVFDYPERLYLVLERAMGGELFDRVVKHDGLTEQAAKLYFYQMLLAIDYLHKQNVTHRDLKPENILLATEDEHTLIKVTDFGLSKLVGEQSLMKTLCGTPNYLAPEIVKTSGLGHYNSKVDIWSLGVILFIMLSGYPPFSDDYGDIPLIDQIKKARFSFTDESWRSVSKDAKNLISKLIVTNANKRLSSAQALNHSWLKDTEMKKTVEDLIRKDEEKRRSAASDNPLSQVEQENEANVDGDGDGVESESESVSSVATLSLKKTDSLKENSNEISAVDPSQIDADVPHCAKKTKVDV